MHGNETTRFGNCSVNMYNCSLRIKMACAISPLCPKNACNFNYSFLEMYSTLQFENKQKGAVMHKIVLPLQNTACR